MLKYIYNSITLKEVTLMKVIQQGRTSDQAEETGNMYGKETEELFHKALHYFSTHMSLDKIFKIPTSDQRFYEEFATLVANKKCGWRIERVSWGRDRIKIVISDPFEFDAYIR